MSDAKRTNLGVARWAVVRAILRRGDLAWMPHEHFAVLAAVLDRLPNAEASLRRIGREAGVHRGTAARALAAMVASGLLRTTKRKTEAGDSDTSRRELAIDPTDETALGAALDLLKKETAKRREVVAHRRPPGRASATTGSRARATGVVAPARPKVCNLKSANEGAEKTGSVIPAQEAQAEPPTPPAPPEVLKLDERLADLRRWRTRPDRAKPITDSLPQLIKGTA